MLWDKFVQAIRRRSREEWRDFFRERIMHIRIYIQENGEKAAILALLLGIFSVLFFKLFILGVCLLALWVLIVTVISESDLK